MNERRSRLDPELETNLQNAYERAQEQGHELMSVEHLLLAILENSSVQNVIDSKTVNVLGDKLTAHISKTVEITDHDPQPTLGFQRVVQRAFFDAHHQGERVVTALYILGSFFSESGYASSLLKKHNVKPPMP
ncbi:MAG: Clp protease N-terminal domain-containing protein [Pseudomonadota bacterium]